MKKLYTNNGQASLETVMILPLVLFTIFSLILSSMTFFNIKANAIQVNYEVGRYVSQMGYCNINPVGSSNSLSTLVKPIYVDERGYTLMIYDDLNKNDIYESNEILTLTPTLPDPNTTKVHIYCPDAWIKSFQFKVSAESYANTPSLLYVFPKLFVSNYSFLIEFGD